MRRHYDRIHAVCRRIAGPSDADDATQQALIAVVRGLDSFDGRSRFSTWCYRVASNAALDEVRRRGRRPRPTAIGVTPDGDDAVAADPVDERTATSVAAFDERGPLVDALESLPEEFRAAVVLRDVGDLDYAEIAEVLGIPPGTVRSRIARGRRLLAARLRSGNHADDTGRPTTTDPPDDPTPDPASERSADR